METMLTDMVQGIKERDLRWLIATAQGEIERRKLKGFHKVHFYTVARVAIPMVKAASHQEAIDAAINMVDLHKAIDRETEFGEVECADQTLGFLVDEMDDPGYERSVFYGPDGKTELERAPGSTPRILVHVEGGILQGFISDTPDLRVALYDGDTEGVDQERITEIDGKQALVSFIPIDRGDENLDFLDTVFTALGGKQGTAGSSQ